MFNLSWKELCRFHKDDGGAPELSTVLIITLIAIPLILVVVAIAMFAFGEVGTTTGDMENTTSETGSSDMLGENNGPGTRGEGGG